MIGVSAPQTKLAEAATRRRPNAANSSPVTLMQSSVAINAGRGNWRCQVNARGDSGCRANRAKTSERIV